MQEQPVRPAEVLLVEDNENDVILTQDGFREARFRVNLHHVENGRDCMAFLRREPPYEEVPVPDLVLLDLNLPVMNGHQVLKAITADDTLRQLPVVVLTTSADEREILEAYKLRCSSYIVKPIDFEKFMSIIRELTDYWLTVVVLPPRE